MVDERAEVAEDVPPQQLVIVVGEVADRVRGFALVGGPLGDEVMVPEERHLLDEPFAAHRFEPRPLQVVDLFGAGRAGAAVPGRSLGKGIAQGGGYQAADRRRAVVQGAVHLAFDGAEAAPADEVRGTPSVPRAAVGGEPSGGGTGVRAVCRRGEDGEAASSHGKHRQGYVGALSSATSRAGGAPQVGKNWACPCLLRADA